MTHEEIVTQHPSVALNQIIKYEAPTSENLPEDISNAMYCASLTWVRDQGNIAIMRATAYINVRVDHVRNGKWNGAIFIAMAPNDTIELRQNRDGLNYDAFSC